LVTAKVVSDFTCEGKRGLSPTYAAGIYVKKGDAWKAGFHQTLPVSGAKGAPSSNSQLSPAAGTDELTKTLSKMENRWWQEWKDKKTEYFENETGTAFGQLGSEGVTDKATALKRSKDEPCDVKSFATTGFKATQIADNVAVLTYNSTQEGTCRGNALPGKVYSTSVFVKDDDSWKGAFYIETPAAGGGD
jgi:capsid protein